jgi:hypothetical protein
MQVPLGGRWSRDGPSVRGGSFCQAPGLSGIASIHNESRSSSRRTEIVNCTTTKSFARLYSWLQKKRDLSE